MPIDAGTRLYGFCGGEFGRDSYGEKIVVASGSWNGIGWVVAEEDGRLVTATGVNWEQMRGWTREESYE